MKSEYATFVTRAKQAGLVKVGFLNYLNKGKNSQTIKNFYARHKDSIDQVAENAKTELFSRSGENANYNFMQKFAAELPVNLKAELMGENLHRALPSTVLYALAFHTDTYIKNIKKHIEQIEGSKQGYLPSCLDIN